MTECIIDFQNLQGHSSMPFDSQPFCENNVKVPTKHIISIEDITINKELGMGQFGVVQQGTWTTGNQRVRIFQPQNTFVYSLKCFW